MCSVVWNRWLQQTGTKNASRLRYYSVAKTKREARCVMFFPDTYLNALKTRMYIKLIVYNLHIGGTPPLLSLKRRPPSSSITFKRPFVHV
jgi:hypothetical protein